MKAALTNVTVASSSSLNDVMVTPPFDGATLLFTSLERVVKNLEGIRIKDLKRFNTEVPDIIRQGISEGGRTEVFWRLLSIRLNVRVREPLVRSQEGSPIWSESC